MIYVKKIPENLNCPLRLTLKMIEPKWKLCILHKLGDGGSFRPCEIHRMIPEAPPRVIDIRLRELVDDGFIDKIVFPEQPPRSEYSITELGKSLLPVIEAMIQWGVENFDTFIDRFRSPQN